MCNSMQLAPKYLLLNNENKIVKKAELKKKKCHDFKGTAL